MTLHIWSEILETVGLHYFFSGGSTLHPVASRCQTSGSLCSASEDLWTKNGIATVESLREGEKERKRDLLLAPLFPSAQYWKCMHRWGYHAYDQFDDFPRMLTYRLVELDKAFGSASVEINGNSQGARDSQTSSVMKMPNKNTI